MATLKVEVSKTAISRKGTCEVGIRLYHHHEKRLIETGIYVSKTEMTKKWTIRNELVKRKVKALLKDFNAKLKQLELDQYDMNIDAVVNYIVGVGDVSIDIIQYGREWIKEHEDQKCSRNHLVALNAFIKFVGRDSYMCNDISKVFMRSFEKWLGDKKTARSVYPQVIKRMFNSAKQRYNEGREENKVIKRTLEFYHPPHVEIQTEKRALPVDIIRAIANLPDDTEGRAVADLARDVFTISFMLMGTCLIASGTNGATSLMTVPKRRTEDLTTPASSSVRILCYYRLSRNIGVPGTKRRTLCSASTTCIRIRRLSTRQSTGD